MNSTIEQQRVIDHRGGHALVDACPGSGKTTTLVEMALNLVDSGVRPDDIVVLTFGSDPQKDFTARMKRRNETRGIKLPSLPGVRTFHSLGNKLCESFMERGLLPYAVLEKSKKRQEMFAMNILKKHFGPQFKDAQNESAKVVEEFLGFVDFMKAGFLSTKEVFELLALPKDFIFFIPAFEIFEETRKRQEIRFFSDLIYDPVMLLKSREDLRLRVGNKKEYIIVDELQDTSAIQYYLIKVIAGTKAFVTGVGDLDQSIYSWRGSSPELMLHQFKEDFPNPTRYVLSRTFRYGPTLAMMANHVIGHNKERNDSLCIVGRENAHTDVSFEGYLDDAGDDTVRIIKDEVAKGRKLDDIAVLVRLYSAGAPVELAMLREDINYRLEGGISCLYSREMQNLEFILQVATHRQHDKTQEEREVAYQELFKFPHMGLKTEVIERLAKAMARSEDDAVGRTLGKLKNFEDKDYLKRNIQERADILSDIERMGGSGAGASRILQHYIRSTDLFKTMQKMAMSQMEGSEKRERCEVFLRYVASLGNEVSDVLKTFEALRDKQFHMNKNAAGVLLTSIHKAKGQEYPVVIMPGLEAGKFPYEPKTESPLTTIESERRLFFVGITRAVSQLYLLAPKHSTLASYLEHGKFDSNELYGDKLEPSQFLFEMNKHVSEQFSRHISSGAEDITFDGATEECVRYLEEIRSVGVRGDVPNVVIADGIESKKITSGDKKLVNQGGPSL
ncbi:ATP-dependent helicase [Pseudomonas syringae pv. actinidiae]|nr:ATP-dependent helicase [Pseudomonas syringae pv. actinidiae]